MERSVSMNSRLWFKMVTTCYEKGCTPKRQAVTYRVLEGSLYRSPAVTEKITCRTRTNFAGGQRKFDAIKIYTQCQYLLKMQDIRERCNEIKMVASDKKTQN